MGAIDGASPGSLPVLVPLLVAYLQHPIISTPLVLSTSTSPDLDVQAAKSGLPSSIAHIHTHVHTQTQTYYPTTSFYFLNSKFHRFQKKKKNKEKD